MEAILDPKYIMELARKILSNERVAVQNAEYGESRDRVVSKRQKLADEAMQELADYLGQSVRP